MSLQQITPSICPIFLSCVTKEFRPYRDKLAKDLSIPQVKVHVQGDFIEGGDCVAVSDQREGPETEGTLKLSGPSASLLTLPPSASALAIKASPVPPENGLLTSVEPPH